MKKILLFLIGTAVMAGCIKQPGDDITPPAGVVPENFDWKTTKKVSLNLAAKDNLSVAVPFFVYDRGELIASGFMPFNGKITVPDRCSRVLVSPYRLDQETLDKLADVTVRGNTEIGPDGSYWITCDDGVVSKIPTLLDHHSVLYQWWSPGSNYLNFGWDWFCSYWNASGSMQGQSSITIYKDHIPVADADGRFPSIYHTCFFPNCEYYDGENGGTEETETSTLKGTYLFEDLFPSMGDYDMNDFVVEEELSKTVDKSNMLVAAGMLYTVKALGSKQGIAMAVRLKGVQASDVEKVTLFRVSGETEQEWACGNNSSLFALQPGGLETTTSDEAIIPLFDNIRGYDLLPSGVGEGEFNTRKNGISGESPVILVKVAFKSGLQVKGSGFATDVFIMPDQKSTDVVAQRGREIHVSDAGYTAKMNTALFRTKDDATVSAPGKYFRAKNGYVWGIYLPVVDFRYPQETVRLNSAYPRFDTWITSSGDQARDWYEHPETDLVW